MIWPPFDVPLLRPALLGADAGLATRWLDQKPVRDRSRDSSQMCRWVHPGRRHRQPWPGRSL